MLRRNSSAVAESDTTQHRALRSIRLAFAACGIIVGAAAMAALMAWKPASGAPLVFGLMVILGAIVVVGGNNSGGRTTMLVGLAGVAAVVLAPFLGALGVNEPVTDVIGVVGAVAALVTLILVQRQISIAQEQVGIALREIDLVEKDLAYSREQSEFTRTQITELTRRPRLDVTFADGDHLKTLVPARGRDVFSADLLVHNAGDRTARDAYIEALIPWSVLQHDDSEEQIVRRPDTELVDGIAFRRFGKQIAEPIYRDLGRVVGVFYEPLVIEPGSFTLHWRVRDDYGVYPADARWGRLEVRAPAARGSARLTFTPRWPGDLFPMLRWDRSGPDCFVYASLEPDATDQVVVIDERLQRRIEDFVWSMDGLGGTTPVTGEIGIEFTLGDRHVPSSGGTESERIEAEVHERGRHRCYVRSDGAVEVRLPQDDSHPVYQVLRPLGAAYAIAIMLHHEFGTESRARGRFAYKLRGLLDSPIAMEHDRWMEMRLNRDEFIAQITPLLMVLQRAGKTPPVESETRNLVQQFWAPYAKRLAMQIKE